MGTEVMLVPFWGMSLCQELRDNIPIRPLPSYLRIPQGK